MKYISPFLAQFLLLLGAVPAFAQDFEPLPMKASIASDTPEKIEPPSRSGKSVIHASVKSGPSDQG